MTRRVEIVVDELVVRGLAPEAARAAAATFEQRLAELAGTGAAIPPSSEHHVRVPAVDASAAGVGAAAAGAVWRAIESGPAR